MMAPGIYEMSAEDYHADPIVPGSLSSSIAKLLIYQTPRHAFFEHPRLNPNFKKDEDAKFDIGNAAHALMLRDPKPFAILDFADWRKKEAQEQRDEARAAGKIPLLTEQWQRVNNMVHLARMQLQGHQDSFDAFTDGKPEQTLIWNEGETYFRIRPDWLPDDRARTYYDYKTSETADPDTWQRIAFSVGHDIQAAFYRRGVRALGLAQKPRFKFVVQETSEPHALSVIELSDEAMDLADYKIERAIRRWNWCMENNAWPAYPAYTHVIGAPKWHEENFLAREEAEAGMARAAGVETAELLALSLRYQSPNP